MQKKIYFLLCVSLLYNMHIFSFGKKTFFGTRSQGLDAVTEIVSWEKIMYQYNQEKNFGTYAVSFKYSRSFKEKKIAEFLFGSERVAFTGSSFANRNQTDILANYFGLPRDFESTVIFSPCVTNVVIDLSWFHDFEKYVKGLYCILRAPIVHSKWDLNMNEIVTNRGTAFFPAGYMGSSRIERTALPADVTTVFQGTTIFGDVREPLEFGKIFGRQLMNRVAELQATLGWNYNRPRYHVGAYARVGAPTGNASRAEFLFESIVGNCHHWDFGGGVSWHIVAWRNEETDRQIALYFDGHVSHLYKSKQKRSFDFTSNGAGSRYMLIEQIDMPSQNLFFNGTSAENQYNGKLMPAINRTTFDAKISIPAQGDIVFKFAYQHGGFECDLGYNFFAHSKEKLHSRDSLMEDRFAFKGDAQLYGFTPNPVNMPIALNATQSKATINGGQGSGNANFANSNADNATLATTNNNAVLFQLNAADATVLSVAQVQVRGSSKAIFIKDSDINDDSALLSRAISNKLFLYVNYMWDKKESWVPYCGLGAAGEFANTDSEKNSAFSQWLVWVKAGMVY